MRSQRGEENEEWRRSWEEGRWEKGGEKRRERRRHGEEEERERRTRSGEQRAERAGKSRVVKTRGREEGQAVREPGIGAAGVRREEEKEGQGD